jgi:hypothetical protein
MGMAIRLPHRQLRLGDAPPPLPVPTTRWRWGSPNVTSWSRDQLRYPLGTIIADVIDGRPVIARIETHDYYGANPGLAPRPHKGTSLYALADSTGAPIETPPTGWGGPGTPDVTFSGEPGGGLLAKVHRHLVEAHGRLPVWLIPVATTTVGALAGGPVVAALGLLAGFSTYRWLAR